MLLSDADGDVRRPDFVMRSIWRTRRRERLDDDDDVAAAVDDAVVVTGVLVTPTASFFSSCVCIHTRSNSSIV